MNIESVPLSDRPTNRVRSVATDRPWIWLTAGWQDMLATKPIALAYGGAVCLVGWVVSLLLFEAGTLWAILPATSGFFPRTSSHFAWRISSGSCLFTYFFPAFRSAIRVSFRSVARSEYGVPAYRRRTSSSQNNADPG